MVQWWWVGWPVGGRIGGGANLCSDLFLFFFFSVLVVVI